MNDRWSFLNSGGFCFQILEGHFKIHLEKMVKR